MLGPRSGAGCVWPRPRPWEEGVCWSGPAAVLVRERSGQARGRGLLGIPQLGLRVGLHEDSTGVRRALQPVVCPVSSGWWPAAS